MKHISLSLILFLLLAACSKNIKHEGGPHDLVFDDLVSSWDEAANSLKILYLEQKKNNT
ncbi:MAG: hypothetical protein ACQERS_04155 [Bacteroidota bacterium]